MSAWKTDKWGNQEEIQDEQLLCTWRAHKSQLLGCRLGWSARGKGTPTRNACEEPGAHQALKGLEEMNERFFPISLPFFYYIPVNHNHSSAVKKGNNTFICQAPAPRPVVLNLFFTFCSLSIILNTWCVIWYLHSMSTLLLISLTHTSLKRTWHKYNWKWKINYHILNNFCISDLKLNQ